MIYSKRVITTVGMAAGAQTTYVVPAGKTLVVKDMRAKWISGTIATIDIQIFGLGFIWQFNLTTSAKFDLWQGMQVLNAGETLQCAMTVGSAAIIVTGYLLTTL